MTNPLETDAYKFSMATAGFPLRQETFYFSFRKGGWQFIPFDLAERVTALLPSGTLNDAFLDRTNYSVSTAMREALHGAIEVLAPPARSWVYEREPILTITGPSFLVSWLEPQILRFFYPIQLATEVYRSRDRGEEDLPLEVRKCTCSTQAAIAREVLTSLHSQSRLPVCEDEYREKVQGRARRLVEIVGDPARCFEVGMRATSCWEQHRITLQACASVGIKTTSDLNQAQELDLTPVGTMGHEHVQRWGSDLDAYRAMRDMRPHTGTGPSYLLDTYDTLRSGIPAAIRVMQETPHAASIRYDSGNKFAQYLHAHDRFEQAGVEPVHIIEDGLDAEVTERFEQLRSYTNLSPDRQLYGYGGYLASFGALTRDRTSAVYKLSQTSGEPRMKFGDEQGLGKTSVPGVPVIWRRTSGTGPLSVLAQHGEPVPEDHVLLSGNAEAPQILRLCNVQPRKAGAQPYVLSPATQALVTRLEQKRFRD